MVSLGSPADRVILRALSVTVSLEPDADMETVGRSRKVRSATLSKKKKIPNTILVLQRSVKNQSRTYLV